MFFYNSLQTIRNNVRDTSKMFTHGKASIIIVMIFLLTASIISFAKAQNEDAQVTASVLWIEDQTFPKVTAYTTVTNNNIPLANLAQEDFSLSEDDLEISAKSITVAPTIFKNMHLILALDVSTPPEDWVIVTEATQALFETLGSDNQAKVTIFSFGNEVQDEELPEFTNNSSEWQDTIDQLIPGGEFTALYEAIVTTAEFIQDNEASLKTVRTAVIIVTDSRDNVGSFSLDEVIEQAGTAKTPFYVVGYGPKVQPTHPLKEEITATGGQYFTLANADQIQNTLQQIIDQVEQGYKITYSSTLRADEATHNLNISITHPAGQVTVEDEFTAVSTDIEVSLPGLTEDPIARGSLKLVPDISGPAQTSSVTYRLDNKVLATVTKSPYEYIWDSTSEEPGPHILNVQVVDSVGNTGDDEATVTLAEPVVVQIPYGANEIEYGNTLIIEPQIENAVGLTRAELWIDEVVVGSCNTQPCSLTINSTDYSAETHTITLFVEDNLGQTDTTSFALKILPPPPPAGWLERLGNRLGFQNYPTFKWSLQLGFDIFLALIALIFLLLIILIASIVNRRIIRRQHQKSRKQYSLEIENSGNIQSNYMLWAEDPLRSLQFQFVINGLELPYSTKNQLTELSQQPVKQPVVSSGTAPTGTPPPSPTTTRTMVAQKKNGQNGQPSNTQQSLKQSAVKGEQALGFVVAIAGILSTVARLLPGPLGRPIRKISGRLTSTQSKVKYVTQQPAQMARQGSRLQSQVSQITPSSTKQNTAATAKDTPQQAVEQQLTYEEVVVSQAARPPSSTTINTNTPVSKTTQVQKNKGSKKKRHNGYHTVTEPAETPVVAPCSKLFVDLMITPGNPYKTRDYQFAINSNPVKQTDQTVKRTEAVAHISGISWFRRYLPPFVIVFTSLMLMLVIALVTVELIQMDIISSIESLPI